MSTSIKITANKSLIAGAKKAIAKKISITAAAATSTLELFTGSIGTIATFAVAAGGTLYAVGDLITVVLGSGGEKAVFKVSTVDSVPTGVITGLTLVSGGSGYTGGQTYATTTNSVAGTGATVTASTVSDSGTSVAFLSVLANTSNSICLEELEAYSGFSAKITGASAVGYVYYE